jgi:hypothetical protein
MEIYPASANAHNGILTKFAAQQQIKIKGERIHRKRK